MPRSNVLDRVSTGLGASSWRLTQRINLCCRTVETKVPSLNRVLIIHSLLLHAFLLRRRQSALLSGTERANKDGIVNSIRRVGSYFRRPPTASKDCPVNCIAELEDTAHCFASQSSLWPGR